MSTANHVFVKLEAKPGTAKGWLDKGKDVTGAGNGNAATFASIATLLAQATSDTQALDTAQSKAANRGRIEIAARDAAWETQRKSLRAFVAGVQGLCDAAPDAAHARAIAAAAALGTKVAAVRVAPDPKVRVLGNGAARLYARRPVPRRGGAYFEWAMSFDGGKTWVTIPGTNTARTLVQGLTPATSVVFRYRTTLKNVVSEWKQTPGIVVS
jgi:hypothetical protein